MRNSTPGTPHIMMKAPLPTPTYGGSQDHQMSPSLKSQPSAKGNAVAAHHKLAEQARLFQHPPVAAEGSDGEAMGKVTVKPSSPLSTDNTCQKVPLMLLHCCPVQKIAMLCHRSMPFTAVLSHDSYSGYKSAVLPLRCCSTDTGMTPQAGRRLLYINLSGAS